MNKIIILGGGSAGWMTAATLIKTYPNKDITLIESPNTPIVGVGESTLGQINKWLSLLEIKDEEFMPYTDASYKLSIRFENFYKKEDGGFHYPFGRTFEKNLSWGKQNWFVKKYFNKKITNNDYANFINPNMSLVNNNRIFKNKNNELINFDFKNDTAYHFDAIKFGIWLKDKPDLKPQYGKVAFLNQKAKDYGLEKGDLVYFKRFRDYKMNINDKDYYRMDFTDIICKF